MLDSENLVSVRVHVCNFSLLHGIKTVFYLTNLCTCTMYLVTTTIAINYLCPVSPPFSHWRTFGLNIGERVFNARSTNPAFSCSTIVFRQHFQKAFTNIFYKNQALYSNCAINYILFYLILLVNKFRQLIIFVCIKLQLS